MHHQQSSEEADRRSRFTSGIDTPRSASQPPHTNGDSFLSSSIQSSSYASPIGIRQTSPWSQPLSRYPSIPRSSSAARSSSFSSDHSLNQNSFSSAMRESRSFASTFEDEEYEDASDSQDLHSDRYSPNNLVRGRPYISDVSRSRSQSLAAVRPGPIGSPLASNTYGELPSNLSRASGPLGIPSDGSRYGDIHPPGSRYGSLGTIGRSPINIYPTSPTGGLHANGYRQGEISNISPFVRDVGQILLEDGSAVRDLWRDDAPGSGTTSRRHSVSIVQPRRGVVGFNAPGFDKGDDNLQPHLPQSGVGGGGGLLFSDDELAADLGSMNLHSNSNSSQPTSQPSSLPVYAPLSRNPSSADSGYQEQYKYNAGESLTSRNLHTPSEGGFSSNTSSSPPQFNNAVFESNGYHVSGGLMSRAARPPDIKTDFGSGYSTPGQQPHQNATARFFPGQGIQYIPPGQLSPTFNRQHSFPAAIQPPRSPTTARITNPQQPPLYSQQQLQRRPSDANSSVLNELGKGVPLHSVPSSCPLYIVEFKAGRTDLFYGMDPSMDIRTGDLVIVEADRGKDLGKVVNDTITLAEVEAFQKQQQHAITYSEHGVPVSPDGHAGSKKEIAPKRIYGKAQPQDTQLLLAKIQDEAKALELCQSKVKQKKLPMEVIDAEYQWDRRKLTFYFIAEKRIDFRELVRELFRLYKTRIWMASLQGALSAE